MIKINKNSSLYFITFFVFITFGMMYSITKAYSFLEPKIKDAKNSKEISLIQKQLKCENISQGSLKGEIFYYCKNTPIIAKKAITKKAYADVIEYLVFINFDGLITHIDILSHKETPNLGANIEKESWLATLYQTPSNLLKLKQDGGLINSFTSASITPRVLLSSASKELKWVQNNKETLKILILKK